MDDQCRIQRAAVTLLGLKPSQLIDKNCYEVLGETAEPLPDSPFRRMLGTGKEERCDIEVARLGKVFDASVRVVCSTRELLLEPLTVPVFHVRPL